MTALPLAVALALAAPPPAPPLLACPRGAERRGARPLEGFEEWCEAPGPDGNGRREGPARTYYDDGSIRTESSWHEGLLEGTFVERYRGGQKASEGAYAAGYRTGRWSFYFEGGALAEESTFTKGAADGPFTTYWPNGKRRAAGRHCLGAQCGRWLAFDEAGREQGAVDYGELRAAP